MRIRRRKLVWDEKGVAAIEMAFALPVLIVMIWMFVQLAQVYRALAGIQQALGEGARYATLCLNPTSAGCATPTADQIRTKIQNSVYGIGPGDFTIDTPVSGTSGTSKYYDLKVNYTQPTNLLFVPGPTINVSRSKRVWVAETAS
jgi:Flp pilus assembly protein TadG